MESHLLLESLNLFLMISEVEFWPTGAKLLVLLCWKGGFMIEALGCFTLDLPWATTGSSGLAFSCSRRGF